MSSLNNKNIYELIKNNILFYGFESIVRIQIQYGIGFAKAMNMIEQLVSDKILIKIEHTYQLVE